MSAAVASGSAASAGEVPTTLDGRTFSVNMSPQQMFPIVWGFVSLTTITAPSVMPKLRAIG